MDIVERIKHLCIANNTTIKALEREINISNGSIRHWNEKSPAVERVLHVAETFNVSLDWLITGKESNDLTPDELKLVELYRNTNEIGQPLTIKHAEDVQKALPREAASPESSSSKIG